MIFLLNASLNVIKRTDYRRYICPFLVPITKYLKDYFIKEKGLFWLIDLQVQVLGAPSGDGVLADGVLRW